MVERETYRLAAGGAPIRHSYGEDMLLVSDKYGRPPASLK